MYKEIKTQPTNIVQAVIRLADNAFIPFDPANTDYQQFKSDIANGAELQDADGNIMSPDQVATFLQGLK
jgi:hypothetical protein